MVQAAVDGVIDFDKAEPRNVSWQRRTNLLLLGLQQKNERELKKLRFQQAVAVFTWSRLKHDSIDGAAEDLDKLYSDIRSSYYPWQKHQKEDPEQAMVKQAIGSWESSWGALDAEATQAAIAATARRLDEARVQTAKDQSRSFDAMVGKDPRAAWAAMNV